MTDNEISVRDLEPENFPDTWGRPISARELLEGCYQWIHGDSFTQVLTWLIKEQERRGWPRSTSIEYYNIGNKR